DEIRILTDERLKRLEAIPGSREVLADLHDERTNKKLLNKGDVLNRDTIELIGEIEEMTSRQIDVLRKITNEKIGKMQKGDELSPGVIKMVKVYIAMKR